MKKIAVIGGGLAGLSAAYHLSEDEPVVFEREREIGGLCRSFRQDGFTFDCTGHLIHLKTPYIKELISKLLPDAFYSHERRAVIHSKSVATPYPFQANTYGLPPEVVKECLVGFVESMQSGGPAPANFHDWAVHMFGTGIAKHFMLPYNEKFWKRDLKTINPDWASWAIPKPSLEEVVNGALGLTNKGMGYNPRFIYPKSGGIDCLPRAFAEALPNIYTRQTVEHIDPRRKVVRLESGREDTYDALVSTLPLPKLFQILGDTPDSLRWAAAKLQAVSVLNINIGVDRPNVSDQHWIYFPEEQFIFSRAGFPMNFTSAAVPPGASSIYIEITHRPEATFDLEQVYDRALHDLEHCGILQAGDRVLTRHVFDIKCAYVIFDAHRQKYLQTLTDYLESRDIYAAGRYGRWEYHSMEDSILSGKRAADAIQAKLSSACASVSFT
jgi:protoporphyrinogen oxidase